MLELMRKNVGSWMIKVLLFGIVIVFAFWGTASYTTKDANTIIKIDKVRVPYNEYRDMYNALYQSLAETYDQIDSEILNSLDLQGQAIEALKDRYLLLEAAREIDIKVTGEEIAADIAATPEFSSEGFFSPLLFQNFLSINQLTADKYEAMVATDLTIRKITDLIGLSAEVTDQEVEEDLKLLTTLAAVKVLKLTPNLFIREVGAADDGVLADYFDENEELFRLPEQFEQQIVVIDPLDFVDKVEVTAEEIEEWYEDNEKEYMVPAAYSLKHILFAFPENATAESINEIRELAEETTRQIMEGELTFTNAAAKWSADTKTRDRGGDLGMLEESAIENSLLKAISNLEEGEVSDPIPTSRGFEILEVGKVRPQRLRTLDEVQGGIETAIRLDMAREMALDMADDILDRTEDTKGSLKITAENKGLTVFESGIFTRDNYTRVGANLPAKLLSFAFTSEEGEVSNVTEDTGKLYIAQTSRRDDSRIPELDEVRGDVEGSWLINQALEVAYRKGEEMLASLKDGKELTSLSRKVGAQMIQTPEPFTILDNTIPGIDDAGALITDAFALDQPGDATLTRGTKDHHIVVLEEMITPDEEELAQARPAVREALEQQRRREVLEGFLTSLREKYKDKIWVNEDLI